MLNETRFRCMFTGVVSVVRVISLIFKSLNIHIEGLIMIKRASAGFALLGWSQIACSY